MVLCLHFVTLRLCTICLAITLCLSSTASISNAPMTTSSISNSQSNHRRGYPSRNIRKWKRGAVDTNADSTYSEAVSTSQTPEVSSSIGELLSPTDTKVHETVFVAECDMPTIFGDFIMRSYTHLSASQRILEPIVMIYGDIPSENVVVRVHDQCCTGEVFGSLRCDCREQLHECLKYLRKEGGVLIYLQQEGRGIGLSNKIAAYALQDGGLDTVDANTHLGFEDEMREYDAVAAILNDLKIQTIRLVTNSPFKMHEIEKLGVNITERIVLKTPTNRYNLKYLKSKRDRMNHLLPSDSVLEGDGSFVDVYSNDWMELQQSATADAEGYSGKSKTEDVAGPEVVVVTEKPPVIIDKSSVNFGKYAFGRKSVEDAIEAVRKGDVVLVVDDESRENEGDLIMAAELATADKIGFIVRHSSGVICASVESKRLDELRLPPMVVNNEDPKQTAYTISVDYKHGTSTGISAADRALTFRALADPKTTPGDLQRPGHVFPLRYRPGGVLARAGHTEASLDLARLAGLAPAGVLAEVVNDDGSMMRLDGLREMAVKHGLVLTSVQDLVAYRVETESQQQQQ